MKIIYKILFGLLIFFAYDVSAQSIKVSGVLKDDSNGETIPGATVMVKGTTNGTVSDIDGHYTIEVPSGDANLVISFIGYKTQEISVNGKSEINLNMEMDISQLEEVVVVGYGTQKKKVVTGAIASVSAREIQSTPVLRVEQALQGRTPGVQVTNQSGQPGESPTVRIRGMGTTGKGAPLYVVDGFVVGGIDYLNSGDIESIDVLKDAASAAIYGSRAANGVVLITTKGAKEGKLSVAYSAYYGVQSATNKLDMLNAEQYMMIQNEGARNANQTEPFDLNQIPAHDTNWQNELFQDNVPMSNQQVTVSGGNEKSTFTASLNKFSQHGIVGDEKSKFDRYTARINTNHKVNKVFNFGNNLAYSHIIKRGIGSNASFNGPLSSALNMDPLTPVFQTDADILAQSPYSTNPVVKNSAGQVYGISEKVKAEVINPLALIEIANPVTRVDKLVGNVYGEISILNGLKFRTSLSTDLAFVMNDGYTPLFYLNGSQSNTLKTSVYKSFQRYFNWQFDNYVSYSKKINDHNFSVMLGTGAYQTNFEDLSGSNKIIALDDPNKITLNLAQDTTWRANGGANQQALSSVFGRVTYDFKDKYLFTAIYRRDGSSKFGSNLKYGNFKSVGIGWVISDEGFMSNVKFVSFLKTRLSYGTNGSEDIADYQYLSRLDRSQGYTFGSGRVIGASPSSLENSDIHWEASEQLDIALDYGFFKNQLTGSIDYYEKTTQDLLQKIRIPLYTGLPPSVANIGTVRNRGLELALNWRSQKGDFNYAIGVNGAYNKNEVTRIGNGGDEIPGASWAVAGPVTRVTEGLPISYFWGFRTDGLFQNQSDVLSYISKSGNPLQPNAKPGDVRFVDVNGDGAINDDDKTYIGSPLPDFTFGMNVYLEYKGLDFSMLMSGTYGNDIFNGSQRRDLAFTNSTTKILDRWTGEGSSTTVPRYTWTDANNNNRVSDLYIEDGSYLRLKNIQIGYSFPEKIRGKFGASNLRVYISSENLLTFTKYTGLDPEVGSIFSDDKSQAQLDHGIDRGLYPQARTFRVGIDIGF